MPHIDDDFMQTNQIPGCNTEGASVRGGMACPDTLIPVETHQSSAGHRGLRALVEWVRGHRKPAHHTPEHSEHTPFAEGVEGETWEFTDPVKITRHEVK